MADRSPARRRVRSWAALLAGATVALAMPVSRGQETQLEPYKARYQVTFRGSPAARSRTR